MERRRGSRIPASFWIQVKGVDPEPVLRHGDVSVSGVYVDLPAAIGEVGSVQAIVVAPEGREIEVDLLARVVRVVRVEDIWKGPEVVGTALEFLPERADKREALVQLVRHVVATRSYVGDSLQFDSRFDARIDLEARPAALATIVGFGVRGMVLDTQWPAEVGETICCQLQAPKGGRETSLTGQVVRSTLVGDHHRVEVAFPAQSPDRPQTIGDAVDSLIDEVLFDGADDPSDRPRDHLKGSLSRIPLASLLAFFELERMTGELCLEHEAQRSLIFLREGRVVDIEGTSAATVRERLADLVRCSSGQFEFNILPVARPDRLDTPTSALLLDLARESDESGA